MSSSQHEGNDDNDDDDDNVVFAVDIVSDDNECDMDASCNHGCFNATSTVLLFIWSTVSNDAQNSLASRERVAQFWLWQQ